MSQTLEISRISSEIAVLEKEYVMLTFKKSTDALEDTSLPRKTRKKIAKLKTQLNMVKKAGNC